MKARIEGFEVLKDLNSGAITSTDSAKLTAYKNQKLAKKIGEERINKIENDIDEIKTLLRILINKNE